MVVPVWSNKFITALIAILMMFTVLAGCISENEITIDDLDVDDTPGWAVGDWFLYVFSTPDFTEDTARLVVSERDESTSNWMLGISSEIEAQRHALLNHNPFLGRITFDSLMVYENDEPQEVFHFPMDKGESWSFSLFDNNWEAEVVGLSSNGATVEAEASDGSTIDYVFDGRLGFVKELVWVDSSTTERLRMQLTDSGSGYSGDTWFIRATDLKQEKYENIDGELYDSFIDSGHPSGADFDHLYIYLDVSINNMGGSGSLVIKDHLGTSQKTEVWTGGTSERGSISEIPSRSGEYYLEVTCTGQGSFIIVIIAGGIVNHWSI